MKKLIIPLLGALPLLGISQTKNVVSVDRLFPKNDKIAEFEKALTDHAQKYHTGDWSWRVFEILSGPDAGGYQVVEGPNTWAQMDARGDISPEHTADFVKNVAPLTTEKGSSMLSVFLPDLSTVQLTDYTEKIAITHFFIKPGLNSVFEDLVKQAKEIWTASNQTVAVYASSSSGPPQYAIVYRYKTGWKERDDSFLKSFKDRFVAAKGEAAFNSFMEGIQKSVESSWGELLIQRPNLSSK